MGQALGVLTMGVALRRGGGSQQVLLRDAFTDTNGTALAAHTPDFGAAWTVVRGTARVQNNRGEVLTIDGTKGDCIYQRDAGAADMDLQATVNVQAAGGFGLIGRWQDADNFWVFTLSEGLDQAIIFDDVAGTFTNRAFGSVTINPTTDYAVRLVLKGTTITGYVNGVQQATFSSATFQAQTRCGFRGLKVLDQIDDYLVQSAP